MRNIRRQVGATLAEMTVVIGIAALMLGLTIPAANMLLNSFESESGAKSIISSAMASARAIASKEQRYTGIRFQKRYDPNNIIGASQYIIFIVHDPNRTGLANGFRAANGIQPIKLPDSIGVMDLLYSSIGGNNPDVNFSNSTVLTDTTTFSVVFSPSGKLVIHDVQIRNRDGKTASTETSTISRDDIFNTLGKITDPVNPVGMFLQDDYWAAPYNWGLGPESSRNNFVIYDTKKFKQAYNNGNPYSGYLNQLKQIYINPYTGTIINEK